MAKTHFPHNFQKSPQMLYPVLFRPRQSMIAEFKNLVKWDGIMHEILAACPQLP